MAALDGSGGREGLGLVRPKVAEQLAEQPAERAGENRASAQNKAQEPQSAQRDILSLSARALERQSLLETAQFDRNVDEERANLIALQAQQQIASENTDSITGINDDSRQLIAYLS